ncbi:MAG: ribonuclease III [Pseudomonadota bacterium]
MSAEARESRLAGFLDAIDYRPEDPELIERALRHRSAQGRSNERLEFLGDAVLDTVVSRVLFDRFPHATEGVLSRLRASVVKDESLAEMSAGLGLGDLIALGPGELKSGGARRDSIMADALEAVFGAVFIDGGYAAAEHVILAVMRDRLETLELDAARKDAKTELQERLQRDGLALPEYALTDTSGPPHRQRFRVSCRVVAIDAVTEGEGSSRRRAEQRAAQAMLARLKGATTDA